jgi:hypothetical protein
MKDPGAENNGAAYKPNQLATPSERRLDANRENAKKSTGPKTLRGKGHSRFNALKHGLFSATHNMSEEDRPNFAPATVLQQRLVSTTFTVAGGFFWRCSWR